jgi:3-oxoacyl-(acyl-carrier-protein) synthase
MDEGAATAADDPGVVTGLGHVILSPGQTCDPMPYLRIKKLRKYMGVQDDLAVCAAASALAMAGAGIVGERTGLYLVVGSIPFEQEDIDPLLEASLEDARFSMERFSTAGIKAVNGLLTFRCLPNMPAFHVSVQFGIQGPYFVTYPGAGQFYLALERACEALSAGMVDVAVVGGVAHQRNFLSAYHFSRLEHPVPLQELVDAAGFLVLERESQARKREARIRGRMIAQQVSYEPHDPLARQPMLVERFQESAGGELSLPGEMGPASLPALLSREAANGAGVIHHRLESRDGVSAVSSWEIA